MMTYSGLMCCFFTVCYSRYICTFSRRCGMAAVAGANGGKSAGTARGGGGLLVARGEGTAEMPVWRAGGASGCR